MGVVGSSLGGLIASYLLGEEPAIRAAALWNAVADGPAAVRRRMVSRWNRLGVSGGGIDMNGWDVSRTFVKELMCARPLKAIVRTGARVLVIQAEKDESVPVKDARLFERVLSKAGREVVVHLIPGAGHSFESIPWAEEVVATTTEWMVDSL
jgi:dipeptidyl aminopeptidase/acylaminoacyl peptidase